MTSPSNNKRSRRVQFAAACEYSDSCASVVAYDVPSLSQSDKANMWYQPEQFKSFRYDARRIGAECRQLGDGSALEGAYGSMPQHAVSSIGGVPPPSLRRKNSTEEARQQEILNSWTSRADKTRGLERWCNSSHEKARRADSKGSVWAVLDEQDRQRESNEFDDEAIADLYKIHTLAATKFARMMGNADAEVVVGRVAHAQQRIKALRMQQMQRCKALRMQQMQIRQQMQPFCQTPVGQAVIANRMFSAQAAQA